MESPIPQRQLDELLQDYLDEKLSGDQVRRVEELLEQDYGTRERMIQLLGMRGLVAMGGVAGMTAPTSRECKVARGLLPKYHRGRLGPRDVAVVARHFDDCEACELYSRTFDPVESRSRFTKKVAMLGAAAAAAVLLIGAFAIGVRHDPTPAFSNVRAEIHMDFGAQPALPLESEYLSDYLDRIVLGDASEGYDIALAFAEQNPDRLMAVSEAESCQQVLATVDGADVRDTDRLAVGFLTSILKSNHYDLKLRGAVLAPLCARFGARMRPLLIATALRADDDGLVLNALTRLRSLGSNGDPVTLAEVTDITDAAMSRGYRMSTAACLLWRMHDFNDAAGFAVALELLESDPPGFSVYGDLPVPAVDMLRAARNHERAEIIAKMEKIASEGKLEAGRLLVLQALDRDADPESRVKWRGPLLELARSDSESIRLGVLRILSRPGARVPGDQEALELLAKDPSEKVARAARRALK